MGPKPLDRPPRVVLDTNCIVSALLFTRGRLAWMREAWQSGRCVPLASRATAAELIRVLAYPKFKLRPVEQEALLADYLPFVEAFHATDEPAPAGLCDPSDAMFIALARQASADALVSGDADLLDLRGSVGITVIPPAELRSWLE